jgi:pyruvate, orthophosphate dikinase
MIEVPRACVTAGAIAAPGRAEFFSFGTNDLTAVRNQADGWGGGGAAVAAETGAPPPLPPPVPHTLLASLQMTWGFSRDDAPKFIPSYIDKGVLTDDPFATIDK